MGIFRTLSGLFFLALMLPLFAAGAHAEIFPVRATLSYSETEPTPPSLKIESTDGRFYELALRAEEMSPIGSEFFALLLLPMGASENARNLLAPPNWHGYIKFMLAGWDYGSGPSKSFSATHVILFCERSA
jgi:hypothetical protein